MVLLLVGDVEIHSRNFSLMTNVIHFVNDCNNLNFLSLFLLHRSSLEVRSQLLHLDLIISTLEIALTTFHQDVLVLLDVTDVHQCNKVEFPYLLFLCVFFMTSFHPLSIVAFATGISIVWSEKSLCILLSFPRHASLRNRSPKSSETYFTLDSRSIRRSYFFLPKFTLESISYVPDF